MRLVQNNSKFAETAATEYLISAIGNETMVRVECERDIYEFHLFAI